MEKRIDDGVIEIGMGEYEGSADLERIVLPDSVRRIGQRAFCNMPRLTSVVFNDGLQEIGVCAFQGCSNLDAIELPASVVKIGGGAFRECPRLSHLSFRDGGVQELSFNDNNSFAETADELGLLRQCRAECVQRKARKLRKAYSVASETQFFQEYVPQYEGAVAHYRQIENWEGEEKLLREIFYARNNPVSTMSWGMIAEETWMRFDKGVAAEICRRIANAEDNAGVIIKECRRRFDEEMRQASGRTDQHRALFNRIVVSLMRNRECVQIIDINKLYPVINFLRGNGYVAGNDYIGGLIIPTNVDDWCACSHLVYRTLAAALPDKTPFEIGVFAWCIAAVLRSEPSDAEREMCEVLGAAMHELKFAF